MAVFGRVRVTLPEKLKFTQELKCGYSDQCGDHQYTDAIQQQQKHDLNKNNVQIRFESGPQIFRIFIICPSFTNFSNLTLHTFTYAFINFRLSIYSFFQISNPLKTVFRTRVPKHFLTFCNGVILFPGIKAIFTSGCFYNFYCSSELWFFHFISIFQIYPETCLILNILYSGLFHQLNRDYGRHYVYINNIQDHYKHDMHKDHVHKPGLYSEFSQIIPPERSIVIRFFPCAMPADPEKSHTSVGTINTHRAYRTSSITICEKITSR